MMLHAVMDDGLDAGFFSQGYCIHGKWSSACTKAQVTESVHQRQLLFDAHLYFGPFAA